MDRTFNMGLGMLLVVDADAADRVVEVLREAGESPVRCGRVVEGKGVRYAGEHIIRKAGKAAK